MGTGKIATWLALFALLANAGSGLGLEHARPSTALAASTICATQAAISTLTQPKDTAAEQNICALQASLGNTAVPNESAVDTVSDSLLLAVLFAPPEILTPSFVQRALPHHLMDTPSETRHEAAQVLACLPPPEALPLDHALHTLRTPNGPPSTV